MIIQMITPLEFPWNLVMYVVFGAIVFRLFLSDRRFQDWVLGKIRSHDDEPRSGARVRGPFNAFWLATAR
jgi:hypothetical protein